MTMSTVTLTKEEGWKLLADHQRCSFQVQLGAPGYPTFERSGPLHVHIGAAAPADAMAPYFYLEQGEIFHNEQITENVYVRIGALYTSGPIFITVNVEA